MVYKNGKKEYVSMGLFSGLAYGIMMGLWNDLFVGVFGGVLFGILFPYFTSVYAKKLEKKFAVIGTELKATKTVICEGPASLSKKWNATGGWLYLCEDELLFHPQKITAKATVATISLRDIRSIMVTSTQLKIRTDAEELIFIVVKPLLWKQSLEERYDGLLHS